MSASLQADTHRAGAALYAQALSSRPASAQDSATWTGRVLSGGLQTELLRGQDLGWRCRMADTAAGEPAWRRAVVQVLYAPVRDTAGMTWDGTARRGTGRHDCCPDVVMCQHGRLVPDWQGRPFLRQLLQERGVSWSQHWVCRRCSFGNAGGCLFARVASLADLRAACKRRAKKLCLKCNFSLTGGCRKRRNAPRAR